MKILMALSHFRKIPSLCKVIIEKTYFYPSLRKKLERYSYGLKETKKKYSIQGNKYTQKRHRMHVKIAMEFLKKASSPRKGERLIAVLIGGGTASGKTTMRRIIVEKKLKELNIRAVIVDPDERKEYIPEYTTLKTKYPNDAARLVHKESVDICELIVKKLIRHRKHFVYEGTMARTKKYKKLVKKLKKAGYEIYVFIADIPIECAKCRAAERAKVTGRKIPSHIITKTHSQVPNTFEVIKNLVDRYYVYDNRNGFVLIASKDYINPVLYAQFLKKRK